MVTTSGGLMAKNARQRQPCHLRGGLWSRPRVLRPLSYTLCSFCLTVSTAQGA
jgi:hypothetical protein